MTLPELLHDYITFFSSTTDTIESTGFGSIDFDGSQCISVQQFADDLECTTTFWRQKVQKRQRIALIGENSYLYFIHYLGIICANNIAVPLNQNLSSDILATMCANLDVTYCVCDSNYLDATEKFDKSIVVIPLQKPTPSDAPLLHCSTPEPNDIALILHSSGTSGTSKAVQITHTNLTTFPLSIGFTHPKAAYTVLQTLPFYHISGIVPVLEDMMHGHRIYISNAKSVITAITAIACNKVILVPAIATLLLRKQKTSHALAVALSGVKTMLCLGAPLQDTVAHDMQALGIHPLVYYGMTETTGTVSYLGSYKQGASGKIAPFCNVRTVNGEVIIKGPSITPGYYNDKEQTDALIDSEGWLHTEDLGYIDAEGYLYIQGRTKNIIILSNGENISPEALEKQLQTNPAIRESEVYADNGKIAATLYCPGLKKNDVTKADIQAFITNLNKSQPLSHHIQKVTYTTHPLPRNALGKIIRSH